jgi:hypothetical protein
MKMRHLNNTVTQLIWVAPTESLASNHSATKAEELRSYAGLVDSTVVLDLISPTYPSRMALPSPLARPKGLAVLRIASLLGSPVVLDFISPAYPFEDRNPGMVRLSVLTCDLRRDVRIR